MKRLQKQMPAVLLLVLVILLASQGAQANSIIFSNFDPLDDSTYSTSSGWGVLGSDQTPTGLSVAMGFTSGGDFLFTDLFLALAGPVMSANVALMDDNGGKPGAVMESWQTAISPVAHVSSTLHPILSAGAKYWIGVFPAAPDSNLGWAWSAINDAGPCMGAYSSDPEFADWYVYPPIRSAFQVQGSPVPVPGSLLLLGSGLVGLTAWRRRRRG